MSESSLVKGPLFLVRCYYSVDSVLVSRLGESEVKWHARTLARSLTQCTYTIPYHTTLDKTNHILAYLCVCVCVCVLEVMRKTLNVVVYLYN